MTGAQWLFESVVSRPIKLGRGYNLSGAGLAGGQQPPQPQRQPQAVLHLAPLGTNPLRVCASLMEEYVLHRLARAGCVNSQCQFTHSYIHTCVEV